MSHNAYGGHGAHDSAGSHQDGAQGGADGDLFSVARTRVDPQIDHRSGCGTGVNLTTDIDEIDRNKFLEVMIHGLVCERELEKPHRTHNAMSSGKYLWEAEDIPGVDQRNNCPHQGQVDNARNALDEELGEWCYKEDLEVVQQAAHHIDQELSKDDHKGWWVVGLGGVAHTDHSEAAYRVFQGVALEEAPENDVRVRLESHRKESPGMRSALHWEVEVDTGRSVLDEGADDTAGQWEDLAVDQNEMLHSPDEGYMLWVEAGSVAGRGEEGEGNE